MPEAIRFKKCPQRSWEIQISSTKDNMKEFLSHRVKQRRREIFKSIWILSPTSPSPKVKPTKKMGGQMGSKALQHKIIKKTQVNKRF